MEYQRLLLLTIIMLILDYIWITKLSKGIYLKTIKNVQKSAHKMNIDKYIKMTIAYIIILYMIYSVQYNSTGDRLLYGLSAYGLFNFTNGSIFDDWNNSVIIVDTLWGGLLFALVPSIVDLINNFK